MPASTFQSESFQKMLVIGVQAKAFIIHQKLLQSYGKKQ